VSLLSRFERACSAFIERAFARSFPSELAPAHVARKLVAAMEANTRRDDGVLVAPRQYLVRVHPDELERLAGDRTYLEREWGELLRDLAVRVGAYFYGGAPDVRMVADDRVPPGAAEVEIGEERGERAPRSGHAFTLRVIKGVPMDRAFPLQGEMSVGRGERVAIALRDPSVSRRHATIGLIDGSPVVRDLGSTNGTFVNGERVERRELHAGDVLKCGNTEMRVERVEVPKA
jgi:hypothetical protein